MELFQLWRLSIGDAGRGSINVAGGGGSRFLGSADLAPDVVTEDGGLEILIRVDRLPLRRLPPQVLLPLAGVPVVLDGVLGPAWDLLGDVNPLVAELLVGFNEEPLLLLTPCVLLRAFIVENVSCS